MPQQQLPLQTSELDDWTDEELEEFFLLMDRYDDLQRNNIIATLFPDTGPLRRELYDKHMQFFRAGHDHSQRLFIAANRVGKTMGMAVELTYHLTGNYPAWWEGHRFTLANEWWVCGVDSQSTREVLQEVLLGKVGEIGTGIIPRDSLDMGSLTQAKRANTPINAVRVKHQSGNYSTVTFKSYASGRESFQGTAKSIWLDEEAPQDIYTECLTRTATGNNILVMTFTPLKGPTPLIKDYLGEDRSLANIEDGEISPSKWITSCTWDDVPHLNEEVKKSLLNSYPPHQRDARSRGIPALGSGIVLPVAQTSYIIEPFELPKHWKRAYGFDVGRNTAAVWIAEDPETKTIYTYSDWLQVEGNPSLHVQNIQLRGNWLRGAIDTASRGRSQSDGQNLYDIYQQLGLNIQNADKAVEAGLYEILELLVNGRLKIFSTCTGLIQDVANYYRDERGNIVKKNDHRIDAWRYAIHTRDKILRTEAEHQAANKSMEFDSYSINSPDSWMSA